MRQLILLVTTVLLWLLLVAAVQKQFELKASKLQMHSLSATSNSCIIAVSLLLLAAALLISDYLGTLVWKRLLTGMRPLLSSSIPTFSRPKFWVKGRLPMQTSSTSQVRVSFFPPAAASTLKDTSPQGE